MPSIRVPYGPETFFSRIVYRSSSLSYRTERKAEKPLTTTVWNRRHLPGSDSQRMRAPRPQLAYNAARGGATCGSIPNPQHTQDLLEMLATISRLRYGDRRAEGPGRFASSPAGSTPIRLTDASGSACDGALTRQSVHGTPHRLPATNAVNSDPVQVPRFPRVRFQASSRPVRVDDLRGSWRSTHRRCSK